MIKNGSSSEASVTCLEVSSDNKTFVSGSTDKTLRFFNLHYSKTKMSIVDSNSISPYSLVGHMVIHKFLIDEEFMNPKEFINKYSTIHIYPYDWNLFHLIAKFMPSRRNLLFGCIEAKIPILADY